MSSPSRVSRSRHPDVPGTSRTTINPRAADRSRCREIRSEPRRSRASSSPPADTRDTRSIFALFDLPFIFVDRSEERSSRITPQRRLFPFARRVAVRVRLRNFFPCIRYFPPGIRLGKTAIAFHLLDPSAFSCTADLSPGATLRFDGGTTHQR